MEKTYITIPQYARKIGVSHQYIYKIINRLPTITMGGIRFIDEDFNIDNQLVIKKTKNKLK